MVVVLSLYCTKETPWLPNMFHSAGTRGLGGLSARFLSFCSVMAQGRNVLPKFSGVMPPGCGPCVARNRQLSAALVASQVGKACQSLLLKVHGSQPMNPLK